MIKYVLKLLVACFKGEIVEVSRSNEEQGNGETKAYYNFTLKIKTPTYKEEKANALKLR